MNRTETGSSSALEDFRQWLDAVGDEPPEHGKPDAADCDLRDLFAEFAALRQEIRLQNREQARAGRDLAAAAERYDAAVASGGARRRDAGRVRAARCPNGRGPLPAGDPGECATPWCGAGTPRSGCGIGRVCSGARRGAPRASSQGYELAIGRFDRMLSRFDVRPVQTVGRPFDGRVMHAVEARRVDRIGDGVVVEELRSGFVRRDDVLRLADVAVNRRHEEG